MDKRNPYRRVAHFLWGGWEIYGFVSWIGGGVVSNFISFLALPFAQELPVWLKALYGIGLFVVVLIITVIVIRILQVLFKPQVESGLSQSMADSSVGRDVILAGRDVNVNTTVKYDGLERGNSPKLPSPPELYLDYRSSKFGIENDVRIVTVSAWYRSTRGKMRISHVELRLIGETIAPLDWRIIEVSPELYFVPDTKFKLPVGISPGEHNAELFAFANEAWWGPYPFTVSVPEVKH